MENVTDQFRLQSQFLLANDVMQCIRDLSQMENMQKIPVNLNEIMFTIKRTFELMSNYSPGKLLFFQMAVAV